MPMKRAASLKEDEQHSKKAKNFIIDSNRSKASNKSDWLRSAQLWNQTPDSPTTKVVSGN